MARSKRKGLPINGWLSLDEPEGMTSTEAVATVRHGITRAPGRPRRHPRSAGDRRVFAEIALGEATKTVAYIVNGQSATASPPAWARRATLTTARARSPRPARCGPTRRRSSRPCRLLSAASCRLPPRFFGDAEDRRRAATDFEHRGGPGRDGAARGRDRQPHPGGAPGSGPCDLGAGPGPRHLCALRGARSGRAARLLCPCHRVAPASGRPVPRRRRDLHRNRWPGWWPTMPCRRLWSSLPLALQEWHPCLDRAPADRLRAGQNIRVAANLMTGEPDQDGRCAPWPRARWWPSRGFRRRAQPDTCVQPMILSLWQPHLAVKRP